MEKLKMHSPDLVAGNIDKIAALFPNCITETKDDKGAVTRAVDFEQLRQELSSSIVEGPQERYRLDWPGKREALLGANAPIAKTLRPCREESADFDITKNLFIEGDNLDALKLLQESYLGKAKLIYIDPPYNTGKEFIYDDDFGEDAESYFQRSNQKDDAGNRLVANTEANGRFHSDWLSMMYPRLKLARNLLRDDGAIFISIDDNEVGNLRKLCDEIFGEENFVAQIVWQRSKKGDAKLIAKVHEYILCYVRNQAATIEAGIWRRKKDGADDVLKQYADFKQQLKNDHERVRAAMMDWYRGLPESDPRKAHKHYNWSDARGLYFAADFAGPDDGRDSRPRHDILHPITGKPCKKPSTGWRWDEAKTKWALAENPPRIHFGSDETTIPNRKSYLEEISNEPFSSLFYRDGRSATLEVEALVGKGWFQFPKNTDVLAELIQLVTGPDDLIIDFFAGSGSTGHAVWNVNQLSDGRRKFILVQLREPTGREKYPTIADVTKARLMSARRAILDKNSLLAGDLGFRVLKIDTPNMADVYYRPDAIKQADLLAQADNIREDRTTEDLLFQVMLDWGVDLALPIGKETIAGKTVFFVDGNALAACFETDVSEELVTALAKRRLHDLPLLKVVFRDASYRTDSVKINVEQIFKLLSPSTEIRSL
jgi:adenine-specific DNA-methyltransferase